MGAKSINQATRLPQLGAHGHLTGLGTVTTTWLPGGR